jgi:hypothetical protein
MSNATWREKWQTLHRLAINLFLRRKAIELETKINQEIDDFKSLVNDSFTYTNVTDMMGNVTGEVIGVPSAVENFNLTFDNPNITKTEVEVGDGSWFPKISVSSSDSNHVLIIVIIVAVVILAVLIYCYGVKKAKAKSRNHQSITFAPVLSPSLNINPIIFPNRRETGIRNPGRRTYLGRIPEFHPNPQLYLRHDDTEGAQ